MDENVNDGNRQYKYSFRLNEEENRRFLDLLEKSGAHTKTKFIIGMLFGREFRVVKTDIEKHKYYMKLCDYYRQFRGVANNYNQITRAIHRTFDEKKARGMLQQVKTETGKMGGILENVLALTEEFKTLWLSESGEENRSTKS